ncbi:MAG TPA: hypothetical protein VFI61_00185 [Patescibacteria group bacterium]|nr:hypothetical protein [Patescibacteria group bacterium]
MTAFILRKLIYFTLLSVIILFPVKTIYTQIFDMAVFDSCQNVKSETEKLTCERSVIKKSVEQGNVSLAISFYKDTIKNSTQDCHGLGHEIGRDIYVTLKKRGIVRIGDPLTGCTYGFWHGFMSGVTNDINNGENLKIKLADVCKKMLSRKDVNFYECYHGFGLGFVGDPPEYNLWGRPSETVAKGIKSCDNLTPNTEFKDACYAGVFHQTLIYMQDKQYKFELPINNNLFNFCNKFEKKYQSVCLGQLFPIAISVLNKNIPEIIQLLDANYKNIDENTKSEMIYGLVGGKVNRSTDEETRFALTFCFTLPDIYKVSCINGVFTGVMTRTKDGETTAIKYLLEMCNTNNLSEENRDECLKPVLKQVNAYSVKLKGLKKLCQENPELNCNN